MAKRKYWTALKTKQASSSDAIVNVRNQGFEYFHPLYRSMPMRGVRKVTALFPHYLLVRIERHTDAWKSLASTKGVQYILMGGAMPGMIADVFVKELRDLCDGTDDGYYHDPKTSPPTFEPNSPVMGLRGLFEDKYGTYKGRASTHTATRVRVLFDILGRSVEHEMSAYDLQAVA